MEKEKKPVKLNIRSDEIEAILGRTPNWLMRMGIFVLFLFFLILLIGSSFFSYPDVVNAKITISTEFPSVSLVAKVSGRIVDIKVSDKAEVGVNQVLGVIESPSSLNDMLSLKAWLNQNNEPEIISLKDSVFVKEQQLGEIMPYFLDLKSALKDYKKFQDLDYHTRNRKVLEEQILYTSDNVSHFERQNKLLEEEIELSVIAYKRDSLLFEKQVVFSAELEQTKSALLQKKITWEGNMASLANTRTQLSQLKQQLLELELDYQKQKQEHLNNIRQKLDALQDQTEQWDKRYVFRSPYEGQLSFPAFWSKNQYIEQGDIFTNVIPFKKGFFIGKLELPLLKSGKVEEGQVVNIKLDNYPYMEFGILRGVIRSISDIPGKENYKVEVELPNAVRTSYGIELPFSPEMTGEAEIITDDYNILQRLFFPMKSLIKNSGTVSANK